MENKVRLDKLLVEKGMFPSREQARQAILEGIVLINGQPANKAGQFVKKEAEISFSGPILPFVSRGGLKLAHALDMFKINPQGRIALDVGSSTGGFTEVLLSRGAKLVYAIDVGHNQLHPSLRQDKRVISMEGTDIRDLNLNQLTGVDSNPLDLTVIDVSFISLALVLPKIKTLMISGGEIVALIKPQFEVGPENVGKGGVVKESRIHLLAIEGFTHTAEKNGMEVIRVIESPILGKEGNKEFLGYLTF